MNEEFKETIIKKKEELYHLDPENDLGDIEYKLVVNPHRLSSLETQMLFRLQEGKGQCIYWLGVMDDGFAVGLIKKYFDSSFKNLQKLANDLNAEAKIISLDNVGRSLKGMNKFIREEYFADLVAFKGKLDPSRSATEELVSDEDRYVACIEIKFNIDQQYQAVSIGIAGNVDSGKSTLLGVLTSGELDNGRGCARSLIAKYRHELKSGNTSSRNYHIIGYDKDSNVIDFSKVDTWEEIIDKSQKIIKFCDLAGHEKYFKTTIKGIASKPNYVLIMVEASRGLSTTEMTKQHIITCGVYKVPFAIVVSRIDQAIPERYQKTLDEIEAYLKDKYNLYPYRVNNKKEAIQSSKEMLQYDNHNKLKKRLVPILSISNVSGKGLDILKTFCYMLPPNCEYEPEMEVKLYIQKICTKRGIGQIIMGDLASGRIKIGQEVLIGPTNDGKYFKRVIKSLHLNRVPVQEVEAGHACSIALRDFPKDIDNSMVMLNVSRTPPPHIKQFGARIQILSNIPARGITNVTVRKGSDLQITINNINKTAKVVKILEKNGRVVNDNQDNPIEIKMHDRAVVLLEFLNYQFIEVGDLFSFRQAFIYGAGSVIALDVNEDFQTSE